MLGLPKGQVFLTDWTEEWRNLFDIERQAIFNLGTEDNIKIHHIGSTSVKNLKSKPVLDITIEIDNFNNINKYIALLKELDYESLVDR